MIRKIRERLRHARNAYQRLVQKRHDAKRSGDRRAKLAKQVIAARENKDRLAKKLKFLESHADPHPTSAPTITIDGHQVTTWIAGWVLRSRQAGWQGYVVSGYRSSRYSTSLCEAMCSAPTCPGRCAGATSNHSGLVYPAGAVDVDVAHRDQFAAIQAKIGSPLKNALGPADPNHFSYTGR